MHGYLELQSLFGQKNPLFLGGGNDSHLPPLNLFYKVGNYLKGVVCVLFVCLLLFFKKEDSLQTSLSAASNYECC